MLEVFTNALIDTAKVLPFLLAIYIGIEFLEYKFGNAMRERVQRAGKAGPAIGALAGSLPQCGFSVITTALYTERLLTIGTLIAVYLSTSDEAIPIILSQPGKAMFILPLIATKVIIAVIAGYSLDYFFRKPNKKTLVHIEACATGHDNIHHHHEAIIEEKACCGHQSNPEAKNFNPRQLFVHPLVHTIKIFFYIFVATFLINLIIFKVGDDNLSRLFLGNNFLQPVFAALVGLIPNCAASVAVTELYLKGAISYGSVIAGLSASAGLGLIILFNENRSRKNTFLVIGLLVGISALAGIAFQLFDLLAK